MLGRIVEIADDRRHLALLRGFMTVTETGSERREIGRVPLDDIAAIIANAHGVSYTNNLLVALAERCAPFVLCAANHNAVGMLIPIEGNYEQARRFDAQLSADRPTHKRIWASLVRAKLLQQAAVLSEIGSQSTVVSALIPRVRSGDPDNIEAQAARRYWGRLFGDSFRRDRAKGGVNGLLNYGYTVLRAATARAVVAAGLHPTLGVHHSNDGNAMRLVDDLMEPYRPVVDLEVWRLGQDGLKEVTDDAKRRLVSVVYQDVETDQGTTPILVCLQRLAVALAKVYLREAEELDLAAIGMPAAANA
jgi:CRISPR-associated protein Cas1